MDSKSVQDCVDRLSLTPSTPLSADSGSSTAQIPLSVAVALGHPIQQVGVCV